MNFYDALAAYDPQTEEEAADQEVILDFISFFPHTVLLRDNPAAHLTASGLVLTPSLDKALFVHHNLMNGWAWPGGHADGDPDLLAVALREAREETGLSRVRPLFDEIASLDIIPVSGHRRNGRYVSAHLHLSAAFLLIAEEDQPLRIQPEENSAVRWFPVSEIGPPLFSAPDTALYHKLLLRARRFLRAGKPEGGL